jgi:hypothetical protein
MNLGKLESVDLRTVWNNEAYDFTPWLAQEDNLALLGDTIGLELAIEAVEKNVGPFRADIVCKDTIGDTFVLIENQLDRTNHNHLGQLLTYAAGLNAVTIVWIADRFTDEHRATLDWLNEITSEDINFFGLEIELWRIADSPVAPKFNVISKPNDWIKSLQSSRVDLDEITPTKQLQHEYWQALAQELQQSSNIIKARKPRPQHWMNFAVGRSGFRLTAFTNTRDKRIGVQLTIHKGNIKGYYHLLYQHKDEIEQMVGEKLVWREMPENKYSDIILNNHHFDPNNRKQWAQQHEWLRRKLEAFHQAFSPRIKALDITDYIPPDDLNDEDEE